jgi:integrase
MNTSRSAIADLQAKWHILHDLDRGRAVYAIQQDGTSIREIARTINCGESLLRRLLLAIQAPVEDRSLARQGKITTNELVRRAKAAGTAASVTTGRVFRAVSRPGTVLGKGISENVVWYVVRSCALRLELDHLAPHDLRPTCAKLCDVNGGELEQIQFLLGHASVLTTERYLGCKQNLEEPVNDRFGPLFSRDVDSR